MMHLLFESMPFVVGGAYGMVVPRSGLRGLWPNLVIGAFCSCFAGELTQRATEAVVCLAADSAAALVSGSYDLDELLPKRISSPKGNISNQK